jgi:hypothetical protein
MAKDYMAKKKVLKEVMFEEEELIEEVTPEPQLLKEENKKMSKDEFLKSIGLEERPGSARAITAWENYNKG